MIKKNETISISISTSNRSLEFAHREAHEIKTMGSNRWLEHWMEWESILERIWWQSVVE